LRPILSGGLPFRFRFCCIYLTARQLQNRLYFTVLFQENGFSENLSVSHAENRPEGRFFCINRSLYGEKFVFIG